MKLEFPEPYKHQHPPVVDCAIAFEEELTPGQRAADWVAETVGSWRFIIGQTLIFGAWALLNVAGWIRHWDPYPFIFMNLVLSLQAAYAASIIMISQNRQDERDRFEAHNDYLLNQKAEEEVRAMLDRLEAQDRALSQIYQEIQGIKESLGVRQPD